MTYKTSIHLFIYFVTFKIIGSEKVVHLHLNSCRQSTKSRNSTSSHLLGGGGSSAAATNRPILSRLPSRKSTKSLRSLRSGYSRMFMKKGMSSSMAAVGARKRSISVSALASPVIAGGSMMQIHNDYVDEKGNNNSVKHKYERRLSKTR